VTAGSIVAGLAQRHRAPEIFATPESSFAPGGFQDVTTLVGLDRVTLPMGSNFADIDNDGFLDVFLATGRPSYSMLIPDLMFRNAGGRRFEDITTSSGTGHLQKGHGVSFADWDDDGDLDLFVEVGGQTPGDKAHNLLFQNPGNNHHWIKLRLVGTKTNRGAVGAKIRAHFAGVARHVAKSAESNRTRNLAWQSLERTGRPGVRAC
jgi:FG-GAP-like repeat